MTPSKWESSGTPILTADELIICLSNHGGVWDINMKKFINRAWVLGWQLRYVCSLIDRHVLEFPKKKEVKK